MHETGLPEARFADKYRHTAIAGGRVPYGLLQLGKLVVPAHKQGAGRKAAPATVPGGACLGMLEVVSANWLNQGREEDLLGRAPFE